MSFEFLKTDSQILEIDLQTHLSNFLKTRFLEAIARNQFL
jgi:hypothetical protein